MKKSVVRLSVGVGLLVLAILSQNFSRVHVRRDAQGGVWARITFPSERHASNSEFGIGAGEDRAQFLNFYGGNGRFQIFSHNMYGNPIQTRNGKDFEPVPFVAGKLYAAGFDLNNESVAYALIGASMDGIPFDASHPFGLYKTSDAGVSWSQRPVLQIPYQDGHYEHPLVSGKRKIVIDPIASRGGKTVYFGSFTNGIYRSLDGGTTWAPWQFAGNMIKTMTLVRECNRPDCSTALYAIVAGDASGLYSQELAANGKKPNYEAAKYRQGRLFRFKLNKDSRVVRRDELTSPLCVNGFVDIEVAPDRPDEGFVICDGLTGVIAGKTLYSMTLQDHRLKLNGPIFDARKGKIAQKSFGGVWINPYNPKHVVVTAEGPLESSLLYSQDFGQNWGGVQRRTRGQDERETVPDFVSYAPGNFKSPEWEMIRNQPKVDSSTTTDSPLRLEADDVALQGPNISFAGPRSVQWWSTHTIKTLLRSDDYGGTFRPFASGTTNKWAGQVAAEKDWIGVAFGEYGFVFSANAGRSFVGRWWGNTPNLQAIRVQSTVDSRSATPSPEASEHKSGYGIAFNPEGTGEGIGLVGYNSEITRIVPREDRDSLWGVRRLSPPQTTQRKGCVYWSSSPTHPQAVYAGNMRSLDGGVTWENIGMDVLAVSTGNGDILVGRKDDSTVAGNGGWALHVSIDAGATWTQIANPELEEGMFPIRFRGAMGRQMCNSITIDPSLKDPGAAGARLRLAMAGRRGVYIFAADLAQLSSTANTWTVSSTGLETTVSIPTGATLPTPFIVHVAFDPANPQTLFAIAGTHYETLSYWADRKKFPTPYNGYLPKNPVYVSRDGGLTFTQITDSLLPLYMSVTAMHVSRDGRLFLSTDVGLFVRKPM